MKITCPVCGNETEQPRCEQCGFVILTDIMTTRDLFAELMRCAAQRRAELERRGEQICAQLQALQKEVQDLIKRPQQHSEAEQALNAERHRLVEVLQAIAEEKQSKEAGEALLPTIKTVGSIVTYGQYPQDADGTKRPIEWIVLDYNAAKNQALLLSRYGLEAKAFHHEETYPTWEKSDIRAWLNGEFLNNAFSAEEQKRIVTAKLSTPPFKGHSGGKDTEDRIWLLSREEATKYFKDDGARKTTATDYANTHGAITADKGCDWWLRSPGYGSYDAPDVTFDGSLFSSDVDITYDVARPAFILNLGSLVMALPTVTRPACADIVNTSNQRTLAELWADEQAAADLPELGEACLTALKTVGRIVKYGQYPQDADGTKRPIEWIVMAYDAEKNQATLLSRYGLEARQYHHEAPYPTWEKSDIRAWLNGEFLNNAFSAEERKRVVTAKLSTPPYEGHSGGKDTEDRVWLLSLEEAEKYFKGNGARKTTATDYANTHGSYKDSNGCCWWWLRSPGNNSNSASYVLRGGSLDGGRVDFTSYVARPALILDLNSLVMALPTVTRPACADIVNTSNQRTLAELWADEQAAADLPELGEACLTALKTVGRIVKYGQYPQDADGTKRPIEWIVLACDAEKGQLLLISKYGLDEKQYHHKAPCRTWKKSDIRKWLNGKFLQEAFTPEEQKRIVTAKLNTTGYDENSGGEDTEDRIWLLSRQEAKEYFRSNDDRKTTETDYAHANAVWKPLRHRGSWWLRASGDSINNASFVEGDGSCFSISGLFVGDSYEAVRPAMILELGAV